MVPEGIARLPVPLPGILQGLSPHLCIPLPRTANSLSKPLPLPVPGSLAGEGLGPNDPPTLHQEPWELGAGAATERFCPWRRAEGPLIPVLGRLMPQPTWTE